MAGPGQVRRYLATARGGMPEQRLRPWTEGEGANRIHRVCERLVFGMDVIVRGVETFAKNA